MIIHFSKSRFGVKKKKRKREFEENLNQQEREDKFCTDFEEGKSGHKFLGEVLQHRNRDFHTAVLGTVFEDCTAIQTWHKFRGFLHRNRGPYNSTDSAQKLRTVQY